jgi:hypothetical protein
MVVSVQNLPMRKLRLISGSELRVDDLDQYAKIFVEGLSEE